MTEFAVPVEEAIGRLEVIPDYDAGNGPEPCVHTFAASGIGLLGAHWPLPTVEEHFKRHGVEEAGPSMSSMGHGLVVVSEEDGRTQTLFFQTKDYVDD